MMDIYLIYVVSVIISVKEIFNKRHSFVFIAKVRVMLLILS